MRILLRHRHNHLFLQSLDQWTDDANAGLDFRFIDRALAFVRAWHLVEVEVAFAWECTEDVKTVSLERAALRCAA